MVVRHGRVTDMNQLDVVGLLRDMVQQQTAMLQLLRVMVEGQLSVSTRQGDSATASSLAPSSRIGGDRTATPRASETDASPGLSKPPAATEASPSEVAPEGVPELPSEAVLSDLPFAPAAVEQNPTRGARYYQPRPSPAARSIAPEEVELMRRLQEMREASDLILQFGPYKGSTLAQVAMSNPEYIRQLMKGAQRPEVRAAAGRVVQALDAAAEHKPKTRASAHRGRPSR